MPDDTLTLLAAEVRGKTLRLIDAVPDDPVYDLGIQDQAFLGPESGLAVPDGEGDASPLGMAHVALAEAATVEVIKPSIFGVLIITIVYVPILSLTGIEGKTFQPMALTVIFALVGSMLVSLTVMPVLASMVLRRTGGGG